MVLSCALQVWSIRVDIHVLDSGGNLIDACCLAALAALLGFRKPQVEVDQSKGEGEAQVTVFSPEVRVQRRTDACKAFAVTPSRYGHPSAPSECFDRQHAFVSPNW